jgi:vacuolar-type H+-ATPase subunit I/STV1
MTSNSPDLDLALRGFFKDREWPFKIMMGACINCAAFGLFRLNALFIPVSFGMVGLTYGYLLRAMRQSIKGELETLPAWNDFVDLLTSGLSWLSICLGFGFFVLSLLAISLIAADNSKVLNMANPNFVFWATGTFIVLYLLIFLFKFFLAVLMANFAEDEKMLAGFAWLKVMRRIAKQPLPLLIAWLASLTISVSAVLFPTASVVLALLAPFLGFLAEVIAVRMIGQAWAATD